MKCYIFIGLVLISIILVGCKPEAVEPEQPTSAQDSAEPEVQVSEPAVETNTADQFEDSGEAVIEIYSTVPHPFELTIKAGQTVKWVNKDRIAYRVLGDKQESFETDPFGPGVSYTKVYDNPGTYTYYLVPGKAGKIIVE